MLSRKKPQPCRTRGGSEVDPLELLSERFRSHLRQPRDRHLSGHSPRYDRGIPPGGCAVDLQAHPSPDARQMRVRATEHPCSGRPRASRPLLRGQRDAHHASHTPEGAYTRDRRESVPVHTSKTGQSAWKRPCLSTRSLGPGEPRPSHPGPPKRALSASAVALASIGTSLFTCELVGACDALTPKGSPRALGARVDSGWPGKPGLHRPTAPG